MIHIRQLFSMAAFAAVLGLSAPASAQTIINEWPSVKAPPAPELKAVTVDPTSTALLMLDFVKQTCNNDRRPRCVASLPKVKTLLAAARAKNMLIVYSLIPGAAIGDTLSELAPISNEPL